MRIAGTAFATACLTTASLVTASGSVGAAGETLLTADAMSTWQTNGIVWSVEYARGVVYVGGTFTHVRPPGAAPGTNEKPRKNFAAFDAVTGALLPCAKAFSGGENTVRALTASRDGSVLYVGGSFGRVDSTGVANAVALNTADCSLRGDFRPHVSATVRAFDTTDKAVYLGGDFSSVNGQARSRLAALSPKGALLPFRADADRSVRALAVSEKHGKIIVGGDFYVMNGRGAHGLVAVNPSTGAIVQTFDKWIPNDSQVKDVASDGTNFYVAGEGDVGSFDGRLAARLDNGTMLWKDTCQGATQAVVPYKGVLYSGSHAHNCDETPGGFPQSGRQNFLANSIKNETILHWFPDTDDGLGEGVGPRAMVMAKDILWAVGEFKAVNGKPQQGLTRFPAAPDTGAPELPKPTASSTTAGRIKLDWRASWDRDDAILTYQIYRDGTLVKSLSKASRPWDRPQMTYTDSVAPGSVHKYTIKVSDGSNVSGHSVPATMTAAR
ncbi:fibronectin type III domain-containing protein [Streptomyces sp. NPDC000410]|uniref:fibronectin type III domain-containing protein n=1 Tax=Streptomyces sp. NPDC000410 TaxID=3154254 RepID=UPI0033291F3C